MLKVIAIVLGLLVCSNAHAEDNNRRYNLYSGSSAYGSVQSNNNYHNSGYYSNRGYASYSSRSSGTWFSSDND